MPHRQQQVTTGVVDDGIQRAGLDDHFRTGFRGNLRMPIEILQVYIFFQDAPPSVDKRILVPGLNW